MPKTGKEADINCRNATVGRCGVAANARYPNYASTYTRKIPKKCAKPELRRNTINEQHLGRALIASFWTSKSDFGLGFLKFEMTSGPLRSKISIGYGKAN